MPADDSHEISCLKHLLFLKKRHDLKLSSAANYKWPYMGKVTKVSNRL